ncbi:MAG: hypothetical protein ACLPZF_25415, partial [Candidatus Acidiferrales bacterium]
RAIFRSVEAGKAAEGFARESAEEILGFYPIFFLLVGFTVLFLRLDDMNAWLLALLFAGFVAVPSFNNLPSLPGAIQTIVSLYRDRGCRRIEVRIPRRIKTDFDEMRRRMPHVVHPRQRIKRRERAQEHRKRQEHWTRKRTPPAPGNVRCRSGHAVYRV